MLKKLEYITDSSTMRVLIIAREDSRKRYKFILKPLIELNIDTQLLIIKNRVFPSIGNIFKIFVKQKYTHIIFIGTNTRLLIPFILFEYLSSSKLFIRSGGLFESTDNKDFSKSLKQKFFRYINRKFSTYMFRNVSGLITTNKSLCNDLSKFLKPEAVTVVLQQFIEKLPDFNPAKFSSVGRGINCISVTNLNYYDKYIGILQLVRGVHAYTLSKKEKIKFAIAGGGAFFNSLEKEISKLPLTNFLELTLLGFVDNISSIYENADIFLYYSTYDGLPNVLLEAQSHGLPILVNSYAPFHDYLVDGENALFFNGESTVDFVLKFTLIVKDIELRKKMGVNNYLNIKNNYTLSAVTKLLAQSDLLK